MVLEKQWASMQQDRWIEHEYEAQLLWTASGRFIYVFCFVMYLFRCQ